MRSEMRKLYMQEMDFLEIRFQPGNYEQFVNIGFMLLLDSS